MKKVDLEALGANLVGGASSCPHVYERSHCALPWHDVISNRVVALNVLTDALNDGVLLCRAASWI